MYATVEQLEDHLGTDRYLAIVDRDRDGTADTSAVEAALSAASSLADSYLAATLPIAAPYPTALVEAVMAIATYRLAGNAATDTERVQYEDAIGWLRDAARGRAQLSTPTSPVDTTGGIDIDSDAARWGCRARRVF